MRVSDEIRVFWAACCRENPEIDPATPFQVWFFGSTPELAIELADLAVRGVKRATASLVAFNEKHPEMAPVDDGYSVVTDYSGNPLCVVQTTEIRQIPFDEVDAQFAYDEGEGDRSLEDWRDFHWRYFTKEAAQHGLEFNERSLICCERFRMVYPVS